MTLPEKDEEDSASFWNTLRVIFLERLSSPLISTFIISWCITNYKVLVIILGTADVPMKLEKLDTYFYGPMVYMWPNHWGWTLVIPVITTYGYIKWWPKWNREVIAIVDRDNNELRRQKDERRYESKITKLTNQLIAKDTQISILKDEIVKHQEEVERLNTHPSSEHMKRVARSVVDVLLSDYSLRKKVTLSKLRKEILGKGIRSSDFDLALKNLITESVITTSVNTDNPENHSYFIEHAGLSKLVKMGIISASELYMNSGVQESEFKSGFEDI